jgi:hypothetical protein
MDAISKLEKVVLGWARNVPHLPGTWQKWLGVNVWWVALVGAILSGIWFLFALGGILTLVSLLGAVSSAYYVTGNYTSLAIMNAVISLVFLVASGLLLAFAVKPLQDMNKKGWVLLFMALLVEALSVVVSAVLTFSIVGFVINILLGAIGLAVGAYFISEIHGQFSHRVKATIKKA